MTDREKAIVMAYTGVCTLTDDKLPVFYDYVEEIMGSRMDGVQMAMLADEIKRKAVPDFIALCKTKNDNNIGDKWISVKGRLPDSEVAVIAYCKEDGHSWYAFRRNGLWWRPGERLSIKIFGTVTHWMPLPEPPKEE